jgi:hypothetical protein
MPRRAAGLGPAAVLATVGLSAAMLLAACSVLAPPDARLCSAAQSLTAAITLTSTAIDADQAGDLARAASLATQAQSLAQLADSKLDGMPGEAKTDAVWQALQDVYLATGQAATVLLPAYAAGHDTAPGQLSDAVGAMARARAGLPAMCFDIPAGLETPGSSWIRLPDRSRAG